MAGLNSFICKYFSKSLVFYERHFGKNFRPNVASTTVDAEVFFFLIISKNLPLKGKFFEMVSRGCLGGLAPPGISGTRALPPGGV